MDVKELIQKTFGTPSQPSAPGIGADVFGGVRVEPKQKKNDVFNPNIISQAQKTFAKDDAQNQDQQAKNPTKTGTAGNMIPPGWSSQSK